MVSLPRLLARAARPTLVLVDPEVSLPVPADDEVTVQSLVDDLRHHADARWGCVLLVATDRAALRRLVAAEPTAGRSRAVVLWLSQTASPLVPRPRPEWPPLIEVDAHLTEDGSAVTRLRFGAVVPVAEVIAALRTAAGSSGTAAHGGLVIGRAESAGDAEVKVPADLVFSKSTVGTAPHPVTGRVPLVVEGSPVVVDEGVFNASGFRREWRRDVVELPPGRVRDATVAGLREARVVRVRPAATAYDVVALAMAGVPLEVPAPPEGISAELADLLTGADDLLDALHREEYSVRLRRAAATHHSTLAERRRLGAAAGVRVRGLPSVSVLLATHRPGNLDFALGQVAKQTGVDLELVLAPHGFEVDPARVRARLGDRHVVVRPADASTSFGDVLHAAAEAASGDVVLKMDDDDWYGPDVVADLLWAGRISGADLVGMPAELVYLEQLGVTVRRRVSVERDARVVAGGTMLLARDRLRELGGFRSVTRYVDAQLLAAVQRAGGRVYRTQGLGYLLRRGVAGHTWAVDARYFLGRRSVVAQWRGFRPSALLAHDEAELPARPVAAS